MRYFTRNVWESLLMLVKDKIFAHISRHRINTQTLLWLRNSLRINLLNLIWKIVFFSGSNFQKEELGDVIVASTSSWLTMIHLIRTSSQCTEKDLVLAWANISKFLTRKIFRKYMKLQKLFILTFWCSKSMVDLYYFYLLKNYSRDFLYKLDKFEQDN